LNIAEYKKNEIELIYWLLHCDDNKLIEDYNRMVKNLPLDDGYEGLLWLLRKMSIRTRGVIHTRILLLHERFQGNDI
jgi:hypothetical protein